MSKKEEIITYLKEEYNPQAIILHRSRAKGMAGENSDWDFFLLDKKEKKITPEQYKGEALDIQRIDPHLPKDEIVDEHGPVFLEADLVYDTKSIGKEFLAKAQLAAKAGPDLSDDEINRRKNYLLRYLNRMRDRQDQPGAFFYYVCSFYAAAIQYWYEVLQDEWGEPIYKAVSQIEKRDPEYSTLLKKLREDNSPKDKINTAEQIFNYLF